MKDLWYYISVCEDKTTGFSGDGLSPSGKAQDFDSCISLVRIQLAQLSKTPVNAETGTYLQGFCVIQIFYTFFRTVSLIYGETDTIIERYGIK